MHTGLVLIVDDELEQRDIIGKILDGSGIKNEPASGEAEALERVARGDVSLVLIDIGLGAEKAGGVELLKKLRGLDADLPLIFVTGYADGAKDHPDVEIIPKPVTDQKHRRALITKVMAALKERCREVRSIQAHELMVQTHKMLGDHLKECERTSLVALVKKFARQNKAAVGLLTSAALALAHEWVANRETLQAHGAAIQTLQGAPKGGGH